jgi:hypothetical protein
MIHKCKVQCHTVSPTDMDLLGIKEDDSKWLPFAFDMGIINAVKMSTDEKGEASYRCATIFCTDGNTFILDTSYFDFLQKWEEYNSSIWDSPNGADSDNDLTL